MAIEICPLAADFGNWADWAAVSVAALGAVAVFKLGRAANSTAVASLEMSRIEREREELLQRREYELLARELSTEVQAKLLEASSLLRMRDFAKYAFDEDSGLVRGFQRLTLPTVERERARMHILPLDAATDVFQAQVRLQMAREAAHLYATVHHDAEHADSFLALVFSTTEMAVESLAHAARSLRILQDGGATAENA